MPLLNLILYEMKNVDVLKISPEKLLKNDELSKLRGGLNCICTNSSGQIVITGSAQNYGECQSMCDAYGALPVYMEQ
jgi:hypothetical protein